MPDLSKLFITLGVLFILGGLGYWAISKWSFLNGLGKLPGDIRIERENVKIYFPLMTSLLLSAVLSLGLYLWQKFFGGK